MVWTVGSVCLLFISRMFDHTKRIYKDFKIQRRDGNENVKKAIVLINETTTLHVHHTFLSISLRLLQDYDVRLPNVAFYGEREKSNEKVIFLSLTWIWSL